MKAMKAMDEMALAMRMLMGDYDPDQPRDENGRWTDGGGSDITSYAGEYMKSRSEYSNFKEITGVSKPYSDGGTTWVDVTYVDKDGNTDTAIVPADPFLEKGGSNKGDSPDYDPDDLRSKAKDALRGITGRKKNESIKWRNPADGHHLEAHVERVKGQYSNSYRIVIDDMDDRDPEYDNPNRLWYQYYDSIGQVKDRIKQYMK